MYLAFIREFALDMMCNNTGTECPLMYNKHSSVSPCKTFYDFLRQNSSSCLEKVSNKPTSNLLKFLSELECTFFCN